MVDILRCAVRSAVLRKYEFNGVLGARKFGNGDLDRKVEFAVDVVYADLHGGYHEGDDLVFLINIINAERLQPGLEGNVRDIVFLLYHGENLLPVFLYNVHFIFLFGDKKLP